MTKTLGAIAVLGVTSLLVGVGGLAASASTTPVFPGTQGTTAAYGFDGNANVVVGGGSDTTWRVVNSLENLYNESTDSGTALCQVQKTVTPFTPGSAYPPATPVLGQCDPASQTFLPANYDGDVLAQSAPVGSSAGIASLNGNNGGTAGVFPIEGSNANVSTADGTDNGLGVADFARSSRGPKLTAGSCAGTGPPPANNTNDELACDTFWGYAEDGIEVVLFNSMAAVTPTINLTFAQLDGIYNCTITTWNQINSSLPADPIVPWSMNTSSGTYATFNSLVAAGASDPSFAADNNAGAGAGCVRQLANPALPSGNGHNPLENDIKSFVNDAQNFGDSRPATAGGGAPAGLSTSPTSTQDPSNWIWWSSFGVLSTFPFTSSVTVGGVAVTTAPSTVNGVAVSSASIGLNRYPMDRTLYHVTKKADADCPTNPNQPISTTTSLNPKSCDFTSVTTGVTTPYCNAVSNPTGQPELDVITSADTYTTVSGCRTPSQTGTTGVSGAVREFTRFICRSSSVDAASIDPFTGASYSTEITSALVGSGFTAVPTALRSPGSNCSVLSQG